MTSAARPLSVNERQILRLIRREQPISRSELARRTGLALPTVSRLIEQFVRDAVVAADNKVMMTRMGQPSLPLSIAQHAAYAFGVAVRADALTICLTHLSGGIVASVEEAHEGLTRAQLVARINKAIRRIATSCDIPSNRVCGLGIALPGFFVEDPLRINAPLGMDDWATVDLERDLGDALGLEVIVENDGSAAALGERLYGHGEEFPSLAYLYIDRGLGGGIIIDGKLVRGRHGNSGEFTGMLAPKARADRPTLTSLHVMSQEAGHAYPSLGAMVRSIEADAGFVDQWIERSIPSTIAIISAIGAIMDPDAIVLGGRLPSPIAQRLIAELGFYSVPVRGRDRAFPTLIASTLEGDAAALGASALCFDRNFL